MSADNTQNQSSKYPLERIAGLRPFQPGQSGNPGGMPRGTPKVSVAYARLLALTPAELEAFEPSNVAEQLALARIRAAEGEDKPYNTAEITDRTEGKAPQRIEHANVSDSERMIIRLQERFLARTGIELSREDAIARLADLEPTLAAQLAG